MIGVLGASGAVGSWAAAALVERGVEKLRLGARRAEDLARVRAELLGGAGEVAAVDVTDPARLAEFCAGCELVLNCAGPSYRLQDTVAAAALAAGADYVDVAGDDPAREGLIRRGYANTDRTAVLSAGTLPGLSSIVPRWLANGGEQVTTLTSYVGGLEPCSPVVAQDMLLSLHTGGADGEAFGEPLAAWRGGRKHSRALRVVPETTAPYYPTTVALQPFLSTETIRLALALGLTEVDWFHVHPGPQVRRVMESLPGSVAQGVDPDELAERMIRAAAVDLAGRDPYYRMVFVLGERDGGNRTVALRAPSSYRLTGLVGALAALAVRAGGLPAGIHFAADVLDPTAVVTAVRDSGALDSFTVTADGPDSEEGVL